MSDSNKVKDSVLIKKDRVLKITLWSVTALFAAILVLLFFLFFYKDSVLTKKDRALKDESQTSPQLKIVPSESSEWSPEVSPYSGRPVAEIKEDPEVVGIYPEETKTKLKNELLEIAKSVSENPDNLDNWLRAGVIKKFFGDYLGARDAWEYASLIRPQNSTSFANLGGLYGLYLKDFPKAEFNYKKAIENSPGDIYLYTSLADLYLNTSPDLVSKDRDLSGERPDLEGGRSGLESAVAIIQSGLTANPDNITLLSYLARFYKEQGNFPKALEYYQKVLVLDPSNQAVKAEIEALKKR